MQKIRQQATMHGENEDEEEEGYTHWEGRRDWEEKQGIESLHERQR